MAVIFIFLVLCMIPMLNIAINEFFSVYISLMQSINLCIRFDSVYGIGFDSTTKNDRNCVFFYVLYCI